MKTGFRRFVLSIVLLVCPVVCAAAASPELKLLQQNHNFGEVFQGAAVKQTFRFENAGGEPLHIEKVRTSCGCTAALLSEEELLPGQSGELQVTFDSARFRGPVVKTIYLYSNDPVSPVTQIYLRGRVTPEILQDPLRLDLGSVRPEEEKTSRVRLTNQGDQKIELSSVHVTSPELRAELSSRQLAPGETALVDVHTLARKGTGRINGYVLIGTSSAHVPRLRIPVHGTVVD